MTNYFKSEKAERTFVDAARGLATFNGAGMAGIIALLQRAGAIPMTLVAAGGLFLLGILLAGAAWLLAFIVEEGANHIAHKLDDAMIASALLSALAFLLGVVSAFAYAVMVK